MLLKYQPFLSPTCTAWVIVFHNFTAPTSHQQQSATDILQNCHIKSLHLWARCPKCNICIPRSYDSLHQATGYAHTHPFNGPFSGTTQVSWYQKGKTNLDFAEERDSKWQWHQLGHMQVCNSLQTDPTTQDFYRPDELPATQPTASKH